MRRLMFKDLVATVVVAAVAIPYVGYLVRGEMPFIEDPRDMAGAGIAGLIPCFAAWGFGIHSTFGKVMQAGRCRSLLVIRVHDRRVTGPCRTSASPFGS
jgi:hypothetical protein